MKRILLIALLATSLTSFAQTGKTTTLKISLNDCRTNQFSFPRIKKIYFYKLPENDLSFTIMPQDHHEFPINLENVLVSEYRIAFKNYFGQPVEKRILLTDEETNKIEICHDQLITYPQNTLSKLQDKDSISIYFRTQGCFHWSASRIVITKQADRYLASLYMVNWELAMKQKMPSLQDSTTGLVKTVELNPQHLLDFIRFENELNFVREGGCTTTDWYVIESKYLNKQATDGSCDWRGFYHLSKAFFGEKDSEFVER
jgi:hypothetical protein